MPKLVLDLVEGGSLVLDTQGDFLEVVSIGRDKKEKKLGLLRRQHLPHLQSFIQSEMFAGTMSVVGSSSSVEDTATKIARSMFKEFKKHMGMDEDEGSEDESPKID